MTPHTTLLAIIILFACTKPKPTMQIHCTGNEHFQYQINGYGFSHWRQFADSIEARYHLWPMDCNGINQRQSIYFTQTYQEMSYYQDFQQPK